jgi:hypothetical protein
VKTTFPALGGGTTNLLTGSPFIPRGQHRNSGRIFLGIRRIFTCLACRSTLPTRRVSHCRSEYSFARTSPCSGATDLVLAALNLPSQNAQNPADIPLGSEITGYKRVHMHQLQVTATKAVPQVVGAEQFVFVTEVGYNHLDLPNGLQFEGYGTLLPVLQSSANLASGGSAQPGGWATENSWGYRICGTPGISERNDGVNVTPRVALHMTCMASAPISTRV